MFALFLLNSIVFIHFTALCRFFPRAVSVPSLSDMSRSVRSLYEKLMSSTLLSTDAVVVHSASQGGALPFSPRRSNASLALLSTLSQDLTDSPRRTRGGTPTGRPHDVHWEARVAQREQRLFVYAGAVGGGAGVELKIGDLTRLERGQFLNDSLVEFSLRYALNTPTPQVPPARSARVFCYNTFFYSRLAHGWTMPRGSGRGHTVDLARLDDRPGVSAESYAAVRKWASKVDLFAMGATSFSLSSLSRGYSSVVVLLICWLSLLQIILSFLYTVMRIGV